MQISVVIPTYNRSHVLPRALDSVIGQTFPANEIVVVDDGSSDDTAKMLTRDYPQVRLISSRNLGVSAARNLGIQATKCEWVALLDSDDAWHPEKLARQHQCAVDNPSARIIHCDETWIRNGKHINQKTYHEKSGGDIFDKSLHRCLISPSAVVIEKSLFMEVGLFDESLEACEDYDLWLRITATETVFYVPHKLTIKYGGHADQLSRIVWGLDRFRIKSLHKLLQNPRVAEEKKYLALKVLEQKIAIFSNGARKRARIKDAQALDSLLKDIQRSYPEIM